MGQINTNNYPAVSSLADADLLIVENAVHGTGTTTPKQLRENAIGTDTLQTSAQTVTGAINELDGKIGTAPLQTVSQTLTGAVNELKNEIDTGANIYGINLGKVTGVSSQVASTNIDLERMPKVGERILVNFEESTPNVTSLKTFIDGSGITIPISSGEPTNTYAGLYIFECVSGTQPMSRLWNVVGKNYSGFTVDVDGNVKAAGDIIDGDGNSISGVAEGVSTPKTVSGNPVIIEDALECNAESLVAQIVPIQSGTGDPSPTNVRPISGRTEVNLGRTGKNLFDEVYPNLDSTIRYKSVYVGDGTFTMSSTMPLVNNGCGLFFLTGQATSGADNNTNGVYAAQSRTITSTNGYVTVAYRIQQSSSPASYHTQIEHGSSATSYLPYQGAPVNITIALGTTVYGGNLDVKTGVLTITWAIVDMGSLTWEVTSDSIFRTIQLYKKPGFKNNICSIYKTVDATEMASSDKCIRGSEQNNGVIVKDTSYSDAASFKTAMSGVQLCYELATPTTVQLTGADLALLMGYNRVTSDSGDITLIYKANAVQNLQDDKADNADMVDYIENGNKASRAYSANQFMLWKGDLYKVTTSIASGATITAGTNVTKTTIGAVLTALLNA